MSSHSPSHIGRYEVSGRLGVGGMGVVFRARDPRIGRQVAIKLLSVPDESLRDRFIQEAQSVGNLTHRNIVTVFDFGEHEGHSYIVMEFVEGVTLADQIQDRVLMTLGRKLEIIEELAAGLDYAHNKGIVHRDIKPANVMTDRDGVVKILDFGIARVGNITMTQAGMMLGTPNYMSPEQFETGRVDRRSDVFSFGALFYELLTYTRAFRGDQVWDVMKAVVHGTPTPIHEIVPDIDAGIEGLVGRALEKDPARRYQTLAEFIADLARLKSRSAHTLAVLSLPTAIVPQRERPSGAMRPASERELIAKKRTERIEKYLHEAQAAFDAGNFAAALDACEQVTLLDPDDTRVFDLINRATAAADQLEQERRAQAEVREARERVERDRVEQERAERERVERERAEQERAEQERAEQERADRERVERERAEQERAAQERAVRERAERERAEQERAAQERAARERAEREPVAPRPAAAAAIPPPISPAPTVETMRRPVVLAGAAAAILALVTAGWLVLRPRPAPPTDAAAGPVTPASASAAPPTAAPPTSPPAETGRPPSVAAPTPTPPTTVAGEPARGGSKPAISKPPEVANTPAASAPRPEPVPPAAPPPVALGNPPVETAREPPPPVAAPPPAPPPEPKKIEPPPPDPRTLDMRAIEQVLNQYVAAFNALDADALARLLPGQSASQWKSGFADVVSYHLVLSGTRIDIQGDSATVVCTRQIEQVSRRASKRSQTDAATTIKLRRAGPSWVIESLR